MSNEGRPKGREREARANDRILLNAAREVFAEEGWGAPMSNIAKHAGIGVASIYRRYPSKDELVRQLRILVLGDVIRIAGESLVGSGSAVGRFLRGHVAGTETPLLLTVGRPESDSPEIAEMSEELRRVLERLIAHDIEAGFVPASYTPADLLLGITHLRPRLALPAERAAEVHLRHIDYYLLGLRASITDPDAVSGTGSTWDEWMDLNRGA